MDFLEQQDVGLPVVGHRIPIVPTAAIFDLNFGDGSVRPDREMGYMACANAGAGPVAQGSVGAGTGASVGKLFGIERAMKGGLGSASAIVQNLVVGALVVVNAYGDVTDLSGNILAGARQSPESLDTVNAAHLLMTGKAVSRPVAVENTSLAVIAVNALLNKTSASWIAAQATLGLGRVIRPFHSHIDGDLTVVLGVGEHEADPNQIGLMASDLLARAAIKGIKHANGFGILPAWSDR